MNVEIVATWVWPENLRPFVEMLGRWTGHAFDDIDWVGLGHGIEGTDSDADEWFSYPLDGRPAIEIVAARNEGDEPISVRVLTVAGASEELCARVRAAAEIFNSYRTR